MLGTLKKPLFAFGVIAMAATFCLAPSLTTSATADGEEAIKTFKKGWKKKQKQMDAEERRAMVESLPGNSLDAVEQLATALHDEYWTVRYPAVVKIAQSTDAEVIAAWVELLRNKKTKIGVKENIAFGLANRSNLDEEGYNLLREILKDDSMPWEVRELVARRFNKWPAKGRPIKVSINDNEAETKKIEEKNAKLNAFVQPILKSNLMALYDVLKEVCNDKIAKKNKKSAAFRKLKWSTIYAMETTSSQEWDDDLKAWDIFLTQTGYDHKKDELKDLQYRWREQVDTKVGNVKISGETAVRKKKRRDTNTELIMIPPLGNGTAYFFPFMEEFTHYFDVSFFQMPYAEKGAKGAPNRDGSERTDAYMYPTAEVAKAFDEFRKKKEGNKNLGMFLHGGACFIGMEFAKNNPKKAAFIIVVGGWGTNADVSEGIKQCKDDKDLDLKYYGMINRTNYGPNPRYPEEFTSAKRFLGNTGVITHQFSDRYDTDQFVMNQIWRIPEEKREQVRRSPLIDTEYAFTARPATKVPALFIWGEDDPMYVKGSEKYLKKYFKNLKTVKMKGVSRLPWMEDPITFFDEIEDFMKSEKVWERMDKIRGKKKN